MANNTSSSSSGSDNGDSRNSSLSSASEEERLRRLFNSCDGDGDGFLDGEDLTFMCRMLNMSESVDEVRQQLGLADGSKISFDDFLRCRTRVMMESSIAHPQHQVFHSMTMAPSPVLLSGDDTGVESDASGIMVTVAGNQLTSWPTLSSDSLGALSYTKPESADYDSGARDLSPEPATMSLTQLMETHDPYAYKQLRQAGADAFLDIANRLHAAALTSLKGEIFELKNHILRLATDRSMLDGQQPHRLIPNDAKLGATDFEERLEELTARYEERIIELHSVIAELRKKLERHQINVIREEDEYEESDQAQSTHSNDGESLRDENIEISREFSQVVSDFETALAKKPMESSHGSDALMGTSFTVEESEDKKDEGLTKEDRDTETPPKLPPRAVRPSSLSNSPSTSLDPQVRVEMMALRTDNEELRRQTSNLEVELGQMSEQMGTVMKEKESLMKKVLELQQRLQAYTSSPSPSHSRVVTPTKQVSTNLTHPDRKNSEPEVYPVAKMAELKKLRTCANDMQVLGSEVAMLGVQSTPTAEHLVQSLNDGSSVAELLKTVSRDGGANIGEVVVKEFEVELERRQAKIDHLKAQNDVLTATLEESKSHAERLSVLIGKYESNNTALQLASVFSDHCTEAQDVLTALLDTEMGVLLANCRAAGLGGLGEGDDDQEEITAILQRAHHARRRAEGVARHLLTRLDRNNGNQMSVGSCHPWEDVSTNSRTASTSSTSSSTDIDFSKSDEVRLRDHIQQLKSERAAVRTTVLELESVHVDPITNEPRRRIEAQRLDLENAVLVQELMAVKEEKAELKAKSYLLEKEKRALELRLNGKETQEQAYRVQIDYLKGELSYQQKQEPSPADSRFILELKSREPCELIQDLSISVERERTLKSKVSELMSTLEKISRNSESRHKQSAEFVNDLKRANSALIAAFDKAKKKYQGRLKKMEGQLKNMRDKYEIETTALRQRLSCIENRSLRAQPNETSL
ncbi:colorectal mutant cancer protein-like [Physella acuta]|uniref:colorectal mutant cancer protein-like n=1 Tax=Physella acuta TaxID=109671 RepID=UPI0027DC092D|nr:colorectal mutant cancer protein-like [Physella acuta]XP_059166216.1 colorectal mutant cancer protein-like [Physella acuta]